MVQSGLVEHGHNICKIHCAFQRGYTEYCSDVIKIPLYLCTVVVCQLCQGFIDTNRAEVCSFQCLAHRVQGLGLQYSRALASHTADVDSILICLERMKGSLLVFQLVKTSDGLFHYPSTECAFSSHSIGLSYIFCNKFALASVICTLVRYFIREVLFGC